MADGAQRAVRHALRPGRCPDYPWRMLTHTDTDWTFWCPSAIIYVVRTRICPVWCPSVVENAVRTPIGHSGVRVLEMVLVCRGVCTPGTMPEADFVYIHRGDVPLALVCRGVCTPGTLPGADFVYIHRRDVPLALVCRGVCTPGTMPEADFVYIHRRDVPLVPLAAQFHRTSRHSCWQGSCGGI